MRHAGVQKRYLQNFRGNRFNIVFLLWGCVFHLKTYIFDFFKNTLGGTNGLIKAVHADIQVKTLLAGCKGIVPIKQAMHHSGGSQKAKDIILEMCNVYTRMDSYFGECLQNDDKLNELIHGEVSCFEDELYNKG